MSRADVKICQLLGDYRHIRLIRCLSNEVNYLLKNKPTRATALVSCCPLDTVRAPARDGSDSACLLEANEDAQPTIILTAQLFCFRHLDLDRRLFLSIAARSSDGEPCLANHGGTLSYDLYHTIVVSLR